LKTNQGISQITDNGPTFNLLNIWYKTRENAKSSTSTIRYPLLSWSTKGKWIYASSKARLKCATYPRQI